MSQKNRKKINLQNGGISVTLPALNEAENIEELSKEIIQYFESNHMLYEIIIINDGSSDETGKVADALASKHENISTIHHLQNKGYGKSLKDGFQASKYEHLFFTDSDRQFKINCLDKFLPFMEEGRADMVIGYRVDRKDNFLRKFLACCFNRIVRTIFSLDYKDIDCAFKLFKRGSFECLEVKSDDFLFNTELLAKSHFKKLRIIQLGVEHYPRHRGKSTISFKFIPLTLKKLFSLHREIQDFKRKESLK
jgi:glycosyltransferase involved in cell wall biosynthesis